MNGLPSRCNKCGYLKPYRQQTQMTLTPEILLADNDIRDMLWPFDFAVTDNAQYGPVWFDTADLAPFEVVAQRSSGCVYALVGPERHVLLATSEGQAGIIAANLKECLELVIAHPYWQDVVSRAEGDLEEMRRIFRDGVKDFETDMFDDNAEIADFRPQLRKRLGLDIPRDPAGRLHHALTVLGADVTVRVYDGTVAAPLFG
jgi:hypothetical protein